MTPAAATMIERTNGRGSTGAGGGVPAYIAVTSQEVVMRTVRSAQTQDLSILAPSQPEYQRILRGLQAQGLALHDAEDTAQDAFLSVMEREARGEVEVHSLGYVAGAAKFKRMRLTDKRRPQNRVLSLDSLIDGDSERDGLGDHAEILIDQQANPEPVETIDLESDPVTALRLELVRQGASPYITARGSARSKHSDEVVARARELYATGAYTQQQIAEVLGATQSAVHLWVTRKTRITPSMGGWTRSMIEGAFRDHHRRYGQAPQERDCRNNPALPATKVVHRLYGKWSTAIKAAGLEVRCGDFKEVWTEERIVDALCAWWHRERRYPTSREIVEHRDHSIPSACTLQRKLGTISARRIIDIARQRCATVGCTHALQADRGDAV